MTGFFWIYFLFFLSLDVLKHFRQQILNALLCFMFENLLVLLMVGYLKESSIKVHIIIGVWNIINQHWRHCAIKMQDVFECLV